MKRILISLAPLVLVSQLLVGCISDSSYEESSSCKELQERILRADEIMVELSNRYYPNDLYNVGTEKENAQFAGAMAEYFEAKDEFARLGC
jgi:hypothetical protein